jgi:hypothetical protein
VASVMRCYNGQPDRELQNLLDEREHFRSMIHNAGYSVTYFPDGEFYMAFRNYRAVTKECRSLDEVASELRLSHG